MHRNFALALVVAALAGCASSSSPPATSKVAAVARPPLPFWVPAENAPADAIEHPCGAYVMRSVERLPMDPSSSFGGDWIVEFAADGRELAHWPAPVDYLPEAIDGERLLIVDFRGVALWVQTDGSYSSAAITHTEKPLIDCPELERFDVSASVQCTLLRDAGNGTERRIAYQGVCS